MSVTQLDNTLVDLLDLVGQEALQTLLFEPVAPGELDWHLARLSHRVAPDSPAAAVARRSVEIDRDAL